jgi:allantoin racemase
MLNLYEVVVGGCRFAMTYDNLMRCIEGKDDEFIVAFERSARECIADGADVIIAGGQLFGPAFMRHNLTQISGVPILETTVCGLKFAEMMVTLRRTIGLGKGQSSTSWFRTPPRALVDQVRRDYGII